MKGFLKSEEGLFQLAPKVTTVGREGCDLVVQSPEVDFQHAVIEFSEQEECFVLQDLNTAQGTFVNDCRVQNAAVRLAPGDLIRFGNHVTYYELQVESGGNTYRLSTQTKVAYPPVHQRAAWTQPLTVITDQPPPMVLTSTQALPNLKSVIQSSTATWSNSPGGGVYPRPPSSLRQRPLSAGARRPTYMDRPTSADRTCINNQRNSNGSNTGGVGWVTGPNPSRVITQPQQTTDIALLQEKEQRILRLSEEMKRLSSYEGECSRKDDVIHSLREEIADLQTRLRHRDTSATVAMTTGGSSQIGDGELTQRLLSLDEEVRKKKTEICGLKDQISRLQTDGGQSSGGVVPRQDLNDRVLEINSLKTELDRVRKDKNITSGLITQMQRDMASKDTTISRLTRDIEAVKKEMKEKEQQLASMQAKFRRTQESKKADESLEAKDRELITLKEQHKLAENKVTEQLQLVTALREELDKVKGQASTEKETQKKLQTDFDQVTAKCQDVERAERMVRVDLEQISKRMERLRSRVIQVAFSTPGIRAPDQEISDDDLMDTLRRLVDERTEMYKQVGELKEAVSQASQVNKEAENSGKKLRQGINSAVLRLRERGLTGARLAQEAELLSTLTVSEDVTWVRDGAQELLKLVTKWQTDTEAALEAAGINTRLTDDPPARHISTLHQQHQDTEKQRDDLKQQLLTMETKHREEISAATDVLRQELEDNKKAELERLEIEREEIIQQKVTAELDKQTEKHDAVVEEYCSKVSELEQSVQQLRDSIVAREDEEKSNKDATKEALDAVQDYQKLETELREKITALESSKSDEVSSLQTEVERLKRERTEEEVKVKEQIMRMEDVKRVTLVTLEEKINKAVQKNKDYQAEITSLKATITDLRAKASRPPPAPKPKVIVQKPAVDVVTMETTVLNLQRENNDMKRKLAEQADVILGLRRDLAGASAKLSDMTGELSESQKKALESGQKKIHSQQVELVELRQQMAKLSEIIDKQAGEMQELTGDLSKQRSLASKSKSTSSEQEVRIRELEANLKKEKEEAQKNLKLVEEEGHITSELSSLGAQCRGERHEQVINRQREALSELRARIKALEQANPPLPTQDQALQQVVMLKKELSEIRASRALSESVPAAGLELSPLEQHINRTRGMDASTNNAEASHERSAHRETMEALEMSEQSFLTLLRGIASSLELDNVAGLRTMSHIPKDERVRLAREREAAVELLTSRIKVLIERISRKDELLQDYEKDLAKLRQAEKLAEQKHKQVEGLTTDIRSRTEETQYLRESLQRTKNKLEQEKRLNSNIKSKKTYHLENERAQSKRNWPRHQCPPEDIMGKDAAKKKASNERLKKKNYEIRTLKEELGNKEQSLHDARRKLVTLETTLGYESQRDPFEPPTAEVGTA